MPSGSAFGIQEGQYSVAPELDQQQHISQHRGSRRASQRQIFHLHPGQIQHQGRHPGANQRRSEVGLLDDQPDEQQARQRRRNQRAPQVVHHVQLVLQEPGQEEHDRRLGNLRGLQRERPQLDPTVCAMRDRHGEDHQQQQRGYRHQRKDHSRMAIFPVIDLHQHRHRRQPEHRPDRLLDQKAVRRT